MDRDKFLQTKLRILISGSLPPPMSGLEIYYQTLLNSSLPDRVDLRFVQTSSQKRELSSTGRVTFKNIVYAILDCGRFTWAILTDPPQIAHIGNASGLSFIKHSFCVFIARILSIRVLLHPHCSMQILYYKQPKLWQWFFRRVIKSTNGVIVLSKEWLELRSIVPGCQVFYLPNAVDLKQYRSVAKKHLSEVKLSAPCKILYLGWLGRTKGCFDILEAAHNIHLQKINIVFNLIGGELVPGEIELIRKKIKDSNLEDCVKVHPLVCGEEKLNFLQNTDIFIYPSHQEGMPMAVIEAMACGLPIIASRVGGIPDLIQDRVNGILIEPQKPEQLAAAICNLIKDNKSRNSIKENNFRFAYEKYDIEQHVMHLVQIYQDVI